MYKLSITPKITKELILSKVSEETIFEHYLGVSVKKGLFCSPPVIRTDKTPTASFYRSGKGGLLYKDFAGPSFDCFGCVQHIFQCNFYNALKIVANDFDIIELKNSPKNPPKIEYSNTILEETTKSKISVETKEFTDKELAWWKSFGVTFSTLKKFRVYSIKHVFLNGSYFSSSNESSPIYGYYGGLDFNGEELWRLYMPTKKKYRFLSNWDSQIIQGSQQLPKSGEFIVITKSLKDTMLLYELGIIAVAPTSENIFLSKQQYEKLERRFGELYLLYDLDGAGIKNSKKIKNKFPKITLLFIPKKYKCKDLTDFFKKYGITKTLKLLDEFKNYYICQKE